MEFSLCPVAGDTGELDDDDTYLTASGYAADGTLKYENVQQGFEHDRPHVYLEMDGKKIEAVRFYLDSDIWSESDQKIPDETKVYCLLVGAAMNHLSKRDRDFILPGSSS